MYLYEKYREIHKERKMDLKSAVMQCTCTKGEYYLAGLIDFLIIILPSIIFLIRSIRSGIYDSSYITYGFIFIFVATLLSFLVISKIIFRSTTAGEIVLRLRKVNLNTQILLTKEKASTFNAEAGIESLKLNDTYEMFSNVFDENNQSTVMKKMGIVVVKKRIYKLFLEDYSKNGVIIRPKKNEPRFKSDKIFKEKK